MTPLAVTRLRQNRRSGVSFANTMLVVVAVLITLVGTEIYSTFFGARPGTGPEVLATLVPLAGMVALYSRHLLRGAVASPELTALALIAPISVLWSIHPPTTIERSLPLLVISALGMVLGSLATMRKLIYVFAGVGAFATVSSLAAIVLVPESQGLGAWENTWNGVYNHKNTLGSAAMLAFINLSSAALVSRTRMRLAFALLAALAFPLLIGSESRTSQIMATLAIIGLASGVVIRRYALLWSVGYLVLFAAFIAVASFVITSPLAEPLFDHLDRKPTLSGRIPLWEIVWPMAQEEIWLGYGYAAFWRPDAAHVVAMASNPALLFSPHYSHNGALEILLNAGVLGFGLLTWAILRSTLSAFTIFRLSTDRVPAICLFVILIGILSLNITENFLLVRTSIGWVFFVALVVRLSLSAREVKASGTHGREAGMRRDIRGFGARAERPMQRA
ncbi:MAG: O-antigen ligase family protein [Rhodobacteraceae bacterium]|nr:O-antigen ligase family protein [Paracoccaceae bacterium]